MLGCINFTGTYLEATKPFNQHLLSLSDIVSYALLKQTFKLLVHRKDYSCSNFVSDVPGTFYNSVYIDKTVRDSFIR
jgi:hypothetical protein